MTAQETVHSQLDRMQQHANNGDLKEAMACRRYAEAIHRLYNLNMGRISEAFRTYGSLIKRGEK